MNSLTSQQGTIKVLLTDVFEGFDTWIKQNKDGKVLFEECLNLSTAIKDVIELKEDAARKFELGLQELYMQMNNEILSLGSNTLQQEKNMEIQKKGISFCEEELLKIVQTTETSPEEVTMNKDGKSNLNTTKLIELVLNARALVFQQEEEINLKKKILEVLNEIMSNRTLGKATNTHHKALLQMWVYLPYFDENLLKQSKSKILNF